MNPMRLTLAAALLVDAIGGVFLYRSAFADAPGSEPLLAPILLIAFVIGIAVAVVVTPDTRALALARGVAGMFIVALLLVGLLFFVAANFESGIRGGDQMSYALFFLAGGVTQSVILWSAMRVDGKGVGDSLASTAGGTVAFWALGMVLIGVAFFIEKLVLLR